MNRTNLSDVRALIARAQQVVDAPRPAGDYPLTWLAEAFYLGDVGALAAAAAPKRD